MKSKIVLLALFLILFNCQTETKPQLDYKHASQTPTLKCESVETKLFEEALLSFEADLIRTYSSDQDNLSRAYSQFMRLTMSNRVTYNDLVSEHSLKVYEALKAEKSLWITSENGSKLNFEHPVFMCIGANIINKDLRTTYNALLSTNSMSMRMIGNLLHSKSFTLSDDRYAATFTALITYYGNFKGVDFSQPKTEITEENKP